MRRVHLRSVPPDLQDAQAQVAGVEGRHLPQPRLEGLRLRVQPLLRGARRRPLRDLCSHDIDTDGDHMYCTTAAKPAGGPSVTCAAEDQHVRVDIISY